jgi:hypothetical protein
MKQSRVETSDLARTKPKPTERKRSPRMIPAKTATELTRRPKRKTTTMRKKLTTRLTRPEILIATMKRVSMMQTLRPK